VGFFYSYKLQFPTKQNNAKVEYFCRFWVKFCRLVSIIKFKV
jgi:hypothetical protein